MTDIHIQSTVYEVFQALFPDITHFGYDHLIDDNPIDNAFLLHSPCRRCTALQQHHTTTFNGLHGIQKKSFRFIPTSTSDLELVWWSLGHYTIHTTSSGILFVQKDTGPYPHYLCMAHLQNTTYTTPWGTLPLEGHTNPHLKVLDVMTSFLPNPHKLSDEIDYRLATYGGCVIDFQNGDFDLHPGTMFQGRSEDIG